MVEFGGSLLGTSSLPAQQYFTNKGLGVEERGRGHGLSKYNIFLGSQSCFFAQVLSGSPDVWMTAPELVREIQRRDIRSIK